MDNISDKFSLSAKSMKRSAIREILKLLQNPKMISFAEAVKSNVAFVRGSVFYCNDTGLNTMRINFSYSDIEDTTEGVKRLSQVIEGFL